MVELKIAVVIKNRRFVRAWAVGQQRSSVRHKRRTDEVKKNKSGGARFLRGYSFVKICTQVIFFSEESRGQPRIGWQPPSSVAGQGTGQGHCNAL